LGSNWPGAGLVSWFVRNPVAANLLMVLFLAGGAFTALNIPTQVFPSFAIGQVNVRVVYPGATPGEVEESITRRVEQAILGIEGVERVRSVASEGVGTVTAELFQFADEQIAKDDIESAIDSLADFPPADAEQVQISVPTPLTTVITFALTGPVSEIYLRQAGEQVESDLLAADGISTVTLRGVRDYEISIEVSEDALRAYGLSFDEVASTVRRASVDLSAGEIRSEGGDILLRTNARRYTGADFEQIVLRASDTGARVRLGDVATVIDGFETNDLISLFNGEPAVYIDVQIQESEDLLSVRQLAAEVFENDIRLPPGVTGFIASDQSQVFRDRVLLLLRNAVLGFVLVFLLLVLMLDLRLAFWVAMGVPISFLGGFILFGTAGVTMNFISTFGLIVVLGIVVDDAIVVGENTDRERAKGRSGEEAAIASVSSVAAPVLVGVLTTMAAFAPLIFTGGQFGQIVRPIPVVVICILLISLVEAFLILPSHLAHGGNWSRGPLAAIQSRVARTLSGFADGPVSQWARFAAQRRWLIALAGFVVLAMVCSTAVNGLVRFVFFPSIEAEEISATINLPEGAPFDQTQIVAEQIAEAAFLLKADYEARNEAVIDDVLVTIGGTVNNSSGPGGTARSSLSPNVAQITLQLASSAQRRIGSREVERDWRAKIGPVAGVERLSIISSAGPGGVDIAYELFHPDNATLEAAVTDMARMMADIEGVSEIDEGFNLGKRQLNFELTPAGQAAGLTPSDIGAQIRQAFFGEEIERIQRGRSEVRVYVRYPESLRRDLAALGDFRIRASNGQEIPLSVAAKITETRSYTSIERIDGRRVIEVGADADESILTPDEARAIVEAEILPVLTDRYPGLGYSLAGAGQDQLEDLASLGFGLLVAVLIMFGLLATQLRSYVQPLVVLMAIPFGVGGAILGHFLTGYDLSFSSIFGMVALSGVVVNASIVLIDRYNKNLSERGLSRAEAIAEATSRRFRPVLITTLTTSLGLLPITLEQSQQAQFLIPMTLSLGAGLLFASTAILMLLPSFIMLVEDIRDHGVTAAIIGFLGLLVLLAFSLFGTIAAGIMLAIALGIVFWRLSSVGIIQTQRNQALH
jgi:multidrug efflux pump subunit AcrB